MISQLQKFKNEPQLTGIATDFDGTISAIAQTPDQATIDPSARKLLQRLSLQYKVVSVISGRRAKQLANLVNLPRIFYIGNHGAEYLFNSKYWAMPETQKIVPILNAINKELRPLQKEGIILDNKRYSLSIHYREHENPEQAQDFLSKLLKRYEAPNLKIQKGRMVFDLSPSNINKGYAVKYLVKRFHLENFLYIGDDRTDLDAFNIMDKLTSNSVNGIKVALETDEAPNGLVNTANLVLDSFVDVNNLFKSLLI